MGYGVDRGGGREAKGGSLRRSKKNPGAAAARRGGAVKAEVITSPISLPPPPLFKNSPNKFVDVGVSLLSRKFHGQLEDVLSRGDSADCAGIVSWCSEVERQQELLDLCKTKEGVLYCQLGVHPDNVDKTNKKLHSQWLENLQEIAKSPCCVGIITGLNLRRDHATHFPQEALMRNLCKASLALELPVIVHLSGDEETAQSALQILKEEEVPPASVVIHNLVAACGANSNIAALFAKVGFYASVSAAIIDEGYDADNATLKGAVACIQSFDNKKLLPGSHAPSHTPQSIPDDHLRTLPNETSNMEFVFESIARCYDGKIKSSELIPVSHTNSVKLFNLYGNENGASTKEEDEDEKEEESTKTKEEGKHQDPQAGVEEAQPQSNPTKEEPTPDGDVEGQQHNGEDKDDELKSIPILNAKETTNYTCVKCRHVLFKQTALVTHPLNAKEAPHKRGGGGGGCETGLFLELKSVDTSVDQFSLAKAQRGVVVFDGVDARCGGCAAKIGNMGVEIPCPCGKLVPATSVRILASRVDRNEELSMEELQRRSLQMYDEREQKRENDDFDSDSDDGAGKRKKKTPKVNVKAQNHSNMGNYRNKDFGTAKKKGKDDEEKGEEQVIMRKKQKRKHKKGSRGDSDSD